MLVSRGTGLLWMTQTPFLTHLHVFPNDADSCLAHVFPNGGLGYGFHRRYVSQSRFMFGNPN